MVWQKKFFKSKENRCLALGMALLSLTLVFAVCGDWGSGGGASQIPVIGPAAGPTAQVYSTGANNSKTSYRPEWMACDLSVAASAIAVSSGMAYSADYYPQAYARKACYWADGGERGPPKHEGGMV